MFQNHAIIFSIPEAVAEVVEGVKRYSQIYETFLFGWEILLPHQSLIHTTRSLRHCFPLDAVDLNICLPSKPSVGEG